MVIGVIGLLGFRVTARGPPPTEVGGLLRAYPADACMYPWCVHSWAYQDF